MAIKLEEFNPTSVADLVSALEGELGTLSTKWWKENKKLVSGYLRSLAEATIQTRTALLDGRIKPADADKILHMQEVAFNQSMQFTKFMTLVLAQKALNTAFSLVGWALYNRTGINLFPEFVKPN